MSTGRISLAGIEGYQILAIKFVDIREYSALESFRPLSEMYALVMCIQDFSVTPSARAFENRGG